MNTVAAEVMAADSDGLAWRNVQADGTCSCALLTIGFCRRCTLCCICTDVCISSQQQRDSILMLETA